MSWEHDRYTVICNACGNVGALTLSSDDWNRFRGEWEGFSGAIRAVPTHCSPVCGTCRSIDATISFMRQG